MKRAIPIVVVLGLAGCGGGPTSPSDPNYRNYRGAAPTTVNQTVNVPGGGTIVVEKVTPALNGTAKVGDAGYVWVTERNGSDKYLALSYTVADSPDENPGQRGHDFANFNGSSLTVLAPAQSRSEVLGWSAQTTAGKVTYLRICGYYNKDSNFQIGPGTTPDWALDYRLGWTFQ